MLFTFDPNKVQKLAIIGEQGETIAFAWCLDGTDLTKHFVMKDEHGKVNLVNAKTGEMLQAERVEND
jgi:hypothetical protein